MANVAGVGDDASRAGSAPPKEPTRANALGRGRSVVAGVLGVLAVLLLVVSSIAVWAQAIAFDSAEVSGIVGEALDEPAVQGALAQKVTDQVFAAAAVDERLADAVPPELQRFVPVLVAGAEDAVDRAVGRMLANPDVRSIVTGLVERAHDRAMQVLEGDGLIDAVTVDGAISINLLPLVSRGIERLQDIGIAEDIEVPELTADGDPADQIAQLEEALDRDLPDDFGQLVVYRSDRLAERAASLDTAQRTLALAKRAIWLLVALTIVATVVTLLAARQRWRAALWLGLGSFAAMVVVRSAIQRVVDEAPDLAANPGGTAAISAIVGSASQSLLRLTGLVAVAAVAAVVLAAHRRGWRREDLVRGGAVLAFAAAVVVLGASIVSLVIGIVAALLVVLVMQAPSTPSAPA